MIDAIPFYYCAYGNRTKKYIGCGGKIMVRKLLVFLLIILGIFLIGCANKDDTKAEYTYTGENDSWKVEYNVHKEVTLYKSDGKLDSDSLTQTKLVATYKKDISELSLVKHLKISYKSSTDNGELNTYFSAESPPKTKVFSSLSTSKSSSNANKENKIPLSDIEYLSKDSLLGILDEKILVDIYQDGQKQTIELKMK